MLPCVLAPHLPLPYTLGRRPVTRVNAWERERGHSAIQLRKRLIPYLSLDDRHHPNVPVTNERHRVGYFTICKTP